MKIQQPLCLIII